MFICFAEAELHIKSAVRWPTALVIGAEVMSIGGDVTRGWAAGWRYPATVVMIGGEDDSS